MTRADVDVTEKDRINFTAEDVFNSIVLNIDRAGWTTAQKATILHGLDLGLAMMRDLARHEGRAEGIAQERERSALHNFLSVVTIVALGHWLVVARDPDVNPHAAIKLHWGNQPPEGDEHG